MTDCLFCQIIQATKPCYKVFENSEYLAFLDLNPHAPGHTLIIPKVHYRYVWDMPNPGQLLNLAQKLVIHYRQFLPSTVYQVKIIGERVPHAHLHLLPYPAKSHPVTPLTHDSAQTFLESIHAPVNLA